MLDSRLVTKILNSILSKSQKFSHIQQDTEISPRILRKYLDHMKSDGLIKEKTKNWKIGKSKPCNITEKGRMWLIDNSLFDFLKSFSSIFNNPSILKELKKPENREIFQKVRKEKYSQTIALVRNHFIECAQKGLAPFEELKSLTEWEYNKRFRIIDMDQILCDALKKLSMLIMFYWSDNSWEEIEGIINTHYHVFGPRMKHWFSYRPGSNANIDSHFLQISKEFKRAEYNQENLEKEVSKNERK